MKSIRQNLKEKNTDISKLISHRKLKYDDAGGASEPLTNYLDVSCLMVNQS